MKNLVRIFILTILFISCSTNNNQSIVYIGNINAGDSEGIYYCKFNTKNGNLSAPFLLTHIKQPIFFDIDTKNKILYTVGDITNNNDSTTPSILSYKINEQEPRLTPISNAPAYGKSPCFIDFNNNKILIANYSSGNVCSYTTNKGEMKFENTKLHFGEGPNKQRQKTPHAHSIRFSPLKNYAYSADLGADKIMIYKILKNKIQTIDSIISHPGAGPRHIDFSPNGEIMAILNELDCSVSTYGKNKQGIFKNHLETLTMLPDTFSGFSKAADIHYSPDGKFLYTSNRGFNSITIYKVNGKKLEFIGWETEDIDWPRNFTIDSTGKYILVANRNSNEITVYQRDQDNGTLKKINSTAQIKKPVCIRF